MALFVYNTAMPKARKSSEELLDQVEDIERVGTRANSLSYEEEEKRKRKEEVRKIEKSNRKWTILYIVCALIMFGIGLVLIGLINLWTDGEFYI